MAIHETFVDKLSDIFIAQGIFTVEQAHDMKRLFHESSKEAFDDFLLEEGLISEDKLLKALSEYYQVPSFDALGYFFNHQLLSLFSKEVLLRNSMIPLWLEEDILTFIASEPDNPELREIIDSYVDFGIEFYVGLRRDINDAINEFFDRAPTEVSEQVLEAKEEDIQELVQEGSTITGDDIE